MVQLKILIMLVLRKKAHEQVAIALFGSQETSRQYPEFNFTTFVQVTNLSKIDYTASLFKNANEIGGQGVSLLSRDVNRGIRASS